MNLYTILSSGIGAHDVTGLTARLSAWHDAMVAHERRLRAGTTSDVCDDECPHAEAPALWLEAVAAFGARSQELTFLRSRAQAARRPARSASTPRARAEAADYTRGRASDPSSDPSSDATASSTAAVTAITEV
jgi:hypothetical protein